MGKHNLGGGVQSDDIAYWSSLEKVSEYDVPGTWYPFVVDGVHVANVRLDYRRGEWTIDFSGVGDHLLEVRETFDSSDRDETAPYGRAPNGVPLCKHGWPLPYACEKCVEEEGVTPVKKPEPNQAKVAANYWKEEAERLKRNAYCEHGERQGNCLTLGCMNHYSYYTKKCPKCGPPINSVGHCSMRNDPDPERNCDWVPGD